MATAKKPAVKKAAVKKTPAKKVAKKPVSQKVVEQTELPLKGETAAPVEAAPKRRGRPAGSTKGRKKGKAGRKAAQEFLYSIRPVASDDGLGLDENESPKATALVFVGPFASEKEATEAALDEIGNKKDVEIVLFRDFRRGQPETKVRLVG